MLSDHLARLKRPVRDERAFDHGPGALAEQTGDRAGGDDLHIHDPVGDHEPEIVRAAEVGGGHRPCLYQAPESHGLTDRDTLRLCLRGREVIDGLTLKIRGRDRADEHRDAERRDQQNAARPDALKHRERAGR